MWGCSFLAQAAQLRSEFNIDIRVLGIADSKSMMVSEGGINLEHWRQEWADNKQTADLTAFGSSLANGYIPNLAIIDCTASDAPPAHYLEWIGKGINIITPNKKLGSGPLDRYLAVRNLQRESYIHFFYEVRWLVSRYATYTVHTACYLYVYAVP